MELRHGQCSHHIFLTVYTTSSQAICVKLIALFSTLFAKDRTVITFTSRRVLILFLLVEFISHCRKADAGIPRSKPF